MMMVVWAVAGCSGSSNGDSSPDAGGSDTEETASPSAPTVETTSDAEMTEDEMPTVEGDQTDEETDPFACMTEPYEHSYEFGAIFEGWMVSATYSSASLAPIDDTAQEAPDPEPTDSDDSTNTDVGDASASDEEAAESAAADAGSSDAGMADASTGPSVADAGAPSEEADAPDPSEDAGAMTDDDDSDVLAGTLMELDTNEGAPGSPDGALKLTVPFDGPGQLLLLANVFNTGLNFEGSTVTAQIKVESGLIGDPSATARAKLTLKATDSFVYQDGPAVVLDPSADWVTLTIDADAPSADAIASGYDACEVREIDIEIFTAATGTYEQAVIYIDSIAITPKDE